MNMPEHNEILKTCMKNGTIDTRMLKTDEVERLATGVRKVAETMRKFVAPAR